MNESDGTPLEKFEKSLEESEKSKYVLRLYVTGATPRSLRAIENIRKICSERLEGRYELEVFDLFKHPELAKEAQIVAAPTLVKLLPPPLRKLIGDMSDLERTLVKLDLIPMPEAPPTPPEEGKQD